jgi:hypothetical protein
MVTQRKTKNLGLNRSKDREKIFQYIENVSGIKEKRCGMTNMSKYGFNHTGRNPLPIRNFNLLDVSIENGKVIIHSKDGLQANCMSCERKYRAGRSKKSRSKYSNLTPEEICDEYRKNYTALNGLKKCSRCEQEKIPEDFPISIGMETGLHNTCKACSKSYSESVGDRWIIYSPDGHEVIDKTDKDFCKVCKLNKNLHKDHIFPIAKGGTDNKENIQILCRKHNLSKSDTVISPIIKSVKDIKEGMICERYKNILDCANKNNWSLINFESMITREVRKFIIWKCSLSDAKLFDFFEAEKARNNRKHSIEHAIKKFRKYCGTAILDTNGYISKND